MYQNFRKHSKKSVEAEKKTNIDLSPKGVIVKVVKKDEEPKKTSKTEIVKAKLSPKKMVSTKKKVLSPKKMVSTKKKSSSPKKKVYLLRKKYCHLRKKYAKND